MGDRPPSSSRVPSWGLIQFCAHFWGPTRQILIIPMLPLLHLQGSTQGGGESWAWCMLWKWGCITLHDAQGTILRNPLSCPRDWNDPTAALGMAASPQQNNCPLFYYIVTCDLEMIHPFYSSLDFAIILHFSQILSGMLMCLHRNIFCKINLRTFKMNEHI